jgi:hypothetical protein
MGCPWVHLDGPVWSLYLKLLNVITSSRSLLPQKGSYPQVLKIRADIIEGHYSAQPGNKTEKSENSDPGQELTWGRVCLKIRMRWHVDWRVAQAEMYRGGWGRPWQTYGVPRGRTQCTWMPELQRGFIHLPHHPETHTPPGSLGDSVDCTADNDMHSGKIARREEPQTDKKRVTSKLWLQSPWQLWGEETPTSRRCGPRHLPLHLSTLELPK